MKPTLEIQNISKQFLIGHERIPYYSFRERIGSLFKSEATKEEFWALKDVSFNVMEGESIGIIGRNGAGKSTLLKILSRITPPTAGRIISRGRIASLLEVGTGFHQELSGRENIFMNGSILGMKNAEIKSRFDEIVDFSGVEKFLDTPLKHYSSGMQLRLAFAVAAHLEPEILIIDEVLAVGDIFFQQKCIGKMSQIALQGRTLLFVSHNFSALKSLCQRAIVLNEGVKMFDGLTDSAVDFYNNSKVNNKGRIHDLSRLERKTGQKELIFHNFSFQKEKYSFGEEIMFAIKLKSEKKQHFKELDFGINFYDRNNTCLIHLSNRFIGLEIKHDDDDVIYRFSVQNFLKPGTFMITLFLRTQDTIQDYLTEAIQFTIDDSNNYGYSGTENIQGVTLPEFSIHLENQVPNWLISSK